MPRGGRRAGAGRKPKSATQHFLGGHAGKRALALVPTSRDEVVDAVDTATSAIVMPIDLLSTEGEQAYWARYAPSARAAGTLTAQTVGGLVLLCQVAARADLLWEDIMREGFTTTVGGLTKAHPLWPAYRGLVQRQESLLQRYLLAAMAKPDLAAAPPAKDDDDSAALRQLMAIQ